jgi:hypothetical protein
MESNSAGSNLSRQRKVPTGSQPCVVPKHPELQAMASESVNCLIAPPSPESLQLLMTDGDQISAALLNESKPLDEQVR